MNERLIKIIKEGSIVEFTDFLTENSDFDLYQQIESPITCSSDTDTSSTKYFTVLHYIVSSQRLEFLEYFIQRSKARDNLPALRDNILLCAGISEVSPIQIAAQLNSDRITKLLFDNLIAAQHIPAILNGENSCLQSVIINKNSELLKLFITALDIPRIHDSTRNKISNILNRLTGKENIPEELLELAFGFDVEDIPIEIILKAANYFDGRKNIYRAFYSYEKIFDKLRHVRQDDENAFYLSIAAKRMLSIAEKEIAQKDHIWLTYILLSKLSHHAMNTELKKRCASLFARDENTFVNSTMRDIAGRGFYREIFSGNIDPINLVSAYSQLIEKHPAEFLHGICLRPLPSGENEFLDVTRQKLLEIKHAVYSALNYKLIGLGIGKLYDTKQITREDYENFQRQFAETSTKLDEIMSASKTKKKRDSRQVVEDIFGSDDRKRQPY